MIRLAVLIVAVILAAVTACDRVSTPTEPRAVGTRCTASSTAEFENNRWTVEIKRTVSSREQYTDSKGYVRERTVTSCAVRTCVIERPAWTRQEAIHYCESQIA